jgi:hypothetical protein
MGPQDRIAIVFPDDHLENLPMMELVCILTTLTIYLSYHYALSLRAWEGALSRVLAASLLTCAQIILTELSLGLMHGLYLSVLLIANLTISAAVVIAARRRGAGSMTALLRDDALRIRTAVVFALDIPISILLVVAALTYGWILAAAYFLPPRGLDDLTYHLPTIFQYVQSHDIRLLPYDRMWPFAYPENGELLFMWLVMFTHSVRWMGGLNVPLVVLSVAAAYALFRHFAVRQKDAFFAALLYAFCPVVLMEAGVNYIDILVSFFLLLSLNFALRFYRDRRLSDLYLTGLATGLMCGMKYTGIPLALPLQLLIFPSLGKGRWRHVLGYAAVILFAGGWWYLRNTVVLGDPFFPTKVLVDMPRAIRGTQGGSALQNVLYNFPYWFSRYPLSDAGIGNYDGGFGLVFWGMGFPAWLYVTARSLFAVRKGRLARFVVLAYLPVGFLLLLMNPPQWIDYNGRFGMFVVVIGLLALCEVLRLIGDADLISVIKGLCIALSVVTISLMSTTVKPSYRLTGAVSDAIRHVRASEFKYLVDSAPNHVMFRPVWELLDLLSRDDPAGMACVIAATPENDLYVPAPVYGSKLQNRVLNHEPGATARIDAYVCSYVLREMLKQPIPLYENGQIRSTTVGDVMAKNDYVAVLKTERVCLTLRKDIFARPDIQKIMEAYYRENWPEAIAAAKEITPQLESTIPVITSSDIGYGVRYVDMQAGRPDRVFQSFANEEEAVAQERKIGRCYTVSRPLPGYRSRKVLHVGYGQGDVAIYLNWGP